MSEQGDHVGPPTDQTLTVPTPDGSIDAEYMLEMPAACPHCDVTIDSVHVVRILRIKVNFVSSLPRRGQVMVCPECRAILGGALGGLI